MQFSILLSTAARCLEAFVKNKSEDEDPQRKESKGIVAGMAVGVCGNLLGSSYSRTNEYEADYYGMQYMAKAGYNPKGAVDLMHIFEAEMGRSEYLEIFRSHPFSRKRREENENHYNLLIEQYPAICGVSASESNILKDFSENYKAPGILSRLFRRALPI